MSRAAATIAGEVLRSSRNPHVRLCAAAVLLNARGIEVTSEALHELVPRSTARARLEVLEHWNDHRPGSPGRIHVASTLLHESKRGREMLIPTI